MVPTIPTVVTMDCTVVLKACLVLTSRVGTVARMSRSSDHQLTLQVRRTAMPNLEAEPKPRDRLLVQEEYPLGIHQPRP